jgi:hypothetical protein
VHEIVSPELVLVDAALAAEIRSRLVVPEDTLMKIGAATQIREATPTEEDVKVALRRLSDHFEVDPPEKPRSSPRVLRVVSTVAASCSVALFTIDLLLGPSGLPSWLRL